MPENLPLSLLAPAAPRELRHLAAAERTASARDTMDRRRTERYCGSALGLLAVTVCSPGSPAVCVRVPVLDVSTTGISFLHPAIVAPGSRCVFTLPGVQAHDDPTEGTAVRCRTLDDRVHEIGVRFSCPVDVARLTAAAIAESGV